MAGSCCCFAIAYPWLLRCCCQHQRIACLPISSPRSPPCRSALSAAVLQGSQEMARLLVAAGACSGRGGATQVGHDHPALRALALAAQRGRVELLDLMYPPLARALYGGWVNGWGGHDFWRPVRAG